MVSWPLTWKWTVFFVLWTAPAVGQASLAGGAARVLGAVVGGVVLTLVLQLVVGRVQSWWRNRGNDEQADPGVAA